MDSSPSLKDLRASIRAVDDQLMELVAKRLDLAKQVGAYKVSHNLPIKDFKVEKEVIEKSRARARDLGIYQDLAEDLSKLMIRYALTVQEEFQVTRKKSEQSGARQSIAIVGGNGGMGRWLSQFCDSFGHDVLVIDRDSEDSPCAYAISEELSDVVDADIIILATPISTTNKVIQDLVKLEVSGLVFDICSLKSPLMSSILLAQKEGLKITSVHPMFGPDADILAGRNIVVCDCGNSELADQATALFSATTAHLVRIPLAEHDNLMSYVLGLSHMVNLVFAKSLTESGFPLADLLGVSSSTFNAQIDVSRPVVNENQELYYEIQQQNDYTLTLLEQFQRHIQDYLEAIRSSDADAFKQYMELSRDFFKR